jgi:hypothetical protein
MADMEGGQDEYLELRKTLFDTKSKASATAGTLALVVLALDLAYDSIYHHEHAFVTKKWWFGKVVLWMGIMAFFAGLDVILRRAAFVSTEVAIVRTLHLLPNAVMANKIKQAMDPDLARLEDSPVPEPETSTKTRIKRRGTRKTAAPE